MPVNINFNRSQGGYELANNLETEIAGVAALDAVQGGKLNEKINEVKYYKTMVEGTILDEIKKAKENKFFMINSTYYPDDIPTQFEGFLSIKVEKGTERKQASYTIFHGEVSKTLIRNFVNGMWHGEWMEIPAFSVDSGSYYTHIKNGVQTRLRVHDKKAYLQYQENASSNFTEKELALECKIPYCQYTLVVGGNGNTFYPVVFPFVNERSNTIELAKYVHSPSESTGRMRAKIECGISGWGGYSDFMKIHHYLSDKNFIANASLGGYSVSNPIVWLRGGGIPYLVVDNVNRGQATVYYERTNLSKDTSYPFFVEPTTTVTEKFKQQIQP